jgi:Flp pilus assembly protein TadD
VSRKVAFLLLALSLLLTAGCGVTAKARKDAEVHYILGVSYLREQNPTLALKEFLFAAQLDPKNPDIQNALGQAYQIKGAHAEAETHYRRALELSPGNPLYQNNLADLYLGMERWDDAARNFRKAADNLLFTSPEVALTGLATAYFQKGELLESVSACKEALKHNPRYAQAHLRLGEAYYALGKLEAAVEAYLQAAAIEPRFVLAHYKLGLAYAKLKNPAKAAAAFREVVRLAPADSELARNAADYLKLLR